MANGKPPNNSPVDPQTLASIRDAALGSDWAYQRLTDLSDRIGPRLSGSPGAEAAVTQIADALRAIGLRVTLQPCKVSHWVRGAESAELVAYAGRPEGITQHLTLTTLGGSAATAANGLTAAVVLVHDFDELAARRDQVKNAIVVFDEHFSQVLAEHGHAASAYAAAAEYRLHGPSAAAEMGALAVLVRSVGGANVRLPHTGVTLWKDGQSPIPAAALTAEDTDLIARLAAQGPVSVKLTLTPQTLPDADSHNVIGDIPGREHPEQVVIVSGHLDSWDLGTGAMDDGMGLTAAMGVAQVLQSLGLHPRRTIRVVAWMDEEIGSGGSKAYFESVRNRLATQSAAIESDFGLGRPLGISADMNPSQTSQLQPVFDALQPIGVTTFWLRRGDLNADIGPLQAAGVPEFAPIVDTNRYFDYHHSAADTLDKVDPQNLRLQVAVLAVLSYYLAEMPDQFERLQPAGTVQGR
jgi:hypothetical protein